MDTLVYGFSEAARYLRIAQATLRSWIIGRSYPRDSGAGYFKPLIKISDKKLHLLSFNNLIEAYVLRALRQDHGVSIKAVRTALDYAQSEFNIPRLLLSRDLRTTAGDLFLQRYGELINLSKSGQLALRKMLDAHLKRIEWDSKLAFRLYPFIRTIYFCNERTSMFINESSNLRMCKNKVLGKLRKWSLSYNYKKSNAKSLN